jgi:hypothetical protein
LTRLQQDERCGDDLPVMHLADGGKAVAQLDDFAVERVNADPRISVTRGE